MFSPKEAREWYQAQRSTNAKSPRSEKQKKRKSNPKRVPRDFYTNSAYAHAINRACKKAGIPAWSPNQLRHTAATKIRSEYGIEATRIILGHSSAVTSEIYAESDRESAIQIMNKLG